VPFVKALLSSKFFREDPMAKKSSKTTKSSAAANGRQPPAGKPAKKSPKVRDHVHDEHCDHDEEIELDETESKAVDMVLDSEKMLKSLEIEVNTAVTLAVRKVCKAHGAALTTAQAQNVAMVLFGN
jgi:hypothetical protein